MIMDWNMKIQDADAKLLNEKNVPEEDSEELIVPKTQSLDDV